MPQIIDWNRHIYPWFTDLLKERFTRGFNSILLWVGEAGIGKSYGALALCETMDETFNVDRVTFSAQEFIRVTNKMKSRQWVIIDEPALSGVLGKRTWYQQVQQALVDQLETFRFKQLGVCLCCINSNLLDKTVRTYLCHYLIHVLDRGYGRVYRFQPSQFDSTVRTPFLGEIYLGLPSEELIRQYEEKRAKIQNTRYMQSLRELTIKESTRKGLRELYEEALAIKDRLMDDNGKFSTARIMFELGIGRPRAQALKKLLEGNTQPN